MDKLNLPGNAFLPQAGDKFGTTDFVEELKNGIWPRSIPLWMTGFYLALFIIRPWEVMFPWMADIRFFKIYAILMITVVIFTPKKNFQPSIQIFSVLLLSAALAFSSLFALNPSLSWEPLYEYFTLVVFYFILITIVRSPYELVFIVVVYIVTMLAYLGKAQLEFFFYGQRIWDMEVHRMTGIENTYGGPNALASSIVTSLPFGAFLWSFRKHLSAEWPAFYRKWFPVFLLAYFYFAASSIVFTNSRSGMVGFVFFISLLCFRRKGMFRKLSFVVFGIVVIVSIWQFMPEQNKGRIRTIWAPESGPESAHFSAKGRIAGYKAGMAMFDEFFLTGVGIGNFISYRVNYLDGTAEDAHSLVGQVLGEAGILGGAAFLLLVGTILANCRTLQVLSRVHSDATTRLLSGLGMACSNSLFLLALGGLFGHNMRRYNWLWLAAFTLLAVQYARRHVENKFEAKTK